MNTLTIAIAQITSLPKQIERNTTSALMYMEEAKKHHADIILFPECFLSGYYFPITNDEALDKENVYLQRIQEKAKELSIGVVITTFTKGVMKPRNSAFFMNRDGSIILQYDKVHTCDFSDERMLENGEHFFVCEFDGVTLGVMICYDREYPESARELMLQGAEIILIPNDCSCMKPRLCTLQTRAYENMCGIVMANAPGKNAGNSCAYSPIPWDENEQSIDMELMMADAIQEGLFYARFDLDELRNYRSHEMMGNTFRKCNAYEHLLDESVHEPFIRKKKQSY